MIASGKGMFIWYRSITDGGDIELIAQRAQALGISHVQIKVADGTGAYKAVEARWADNVIEPLIDRFNRMNVEVWLWQYLYNYTPEREAEYFASRLLRYKNRIAGGIIDPEWECKINRWGAKPYMQTLRARIGDMPIGLCSYRFPKLHPELDWRNFSMYSDMWWPQVYWEQAHNPAYQLQRSVNECWAIKHMPVVPVGSAYAWNGWEPTTADLDQFDNKVKALGLRGLSWWVWNTMVTRQHWVRAIGQHVWPSPFESQEPLPPAIKRYIVLPFIGMRLRSGPGTQYEKIGSAKKDEILEINHIEILGNDAWGRLIHQGKTAWVCIRQESALYLKEIL